MATSRTASATPDQWAEPTWEVAGLFPAQGTWSEQEYLALNTSRLVEFSHGRLEVLPMPTDKHQAIVAFLFTAFLGVIQQIGGAIRFAPLRLRLWPGKFREPDIMILRRADDPRRQELYWTGADLVVEVINEDDPERDLVTKRREYAEAGIPEYWLVDPRDETIAVLRLEGTSYMLHGQFGAGDSATSATLPALRVSVSEVFAAQ